MGKSRLAVHVAVSNLDRFPGGVWVVDLAPISDPDLVAIAAARVAGAFRAGTDPLDALAEQVGDRSVVMILDNCEHVLAHAASVVRQLAAACPALRLLATSRRPLGVAGEVTVPVEGLAAPPAGAQGSDLLEYDSVRLFLDRLRAARTDVAVSPAVLTAAVRSSRRSSRSPSGADPFGVGPPR